MLLREYDYDHGHNDEYDDNDDGDDDDVADDADDELIDMMKMMLIMMMQLMILGVESASSTATCWANPIICPAFALIPSSIHTITMIVMMMMTMRMI